MRASQWWETKEPCRQSPSVEFVERRVKGRGESGRQRLACLFRRTAGREREWAKLVSYGDL